MRYSDFILRIEPPSQGVYPVIVQQSPEGVGRGTFRVPFTSRELHPSMVFGHGEQWRDTRPPASQLGPTPREAGNRLFAALFSGEVSELFKRSVSSLRRARDLGLRIRILLDPKVSSSELLGLPWELLCWTDQRDFLALSRKSPIVRSLNMLRPFPRLKVASPIRILAAMADAGDLDLQSERRALEEACDSIPGVALEFLENATTAEVWKRLRDSPPVHVLHYMGHGDFNPATGEGELLLAGNQGPTPGLALAQLIKETPSLRLAFLNGCHTARSSSQEGGDPLGGTAPALLLAGLPAVVAMQYRISDKAAIAFARTFYASLALGEPVEAAVSDGRQAVLSADPRGSEWATPVLFLRSLNGRLFSPQKSGRLNDDTLRVYLRWTVGRLGRLTMTGAAHLKRAPTVRLDSVFVPLRCRRLEPVASEKFPEFARSPRIEGADDLPGALAPFGGGRPFVLLGGAGSGKTTLLQWIAWQHAWARLNRQASVRVAACQADPDADEASLREIDLGPTRIPILIRLADYSAARRSAPALSLNAFLGHHLGLGMISVQGIRGTVLDLAKLHDRLLEALEKGDVLVLLDGLDQIADLQERSEVAREIDLFLDDWLPEVTGLPGRRAGPQVAVTSRPAGYNLAPVTQASRWLLAPLDKSTSRRLTIAWHAALGDGPAPATPPSQAPSFQDSERLSTHPRFVTWLAELRTSDSRGVLRRRIQLYDAIMNLEIHEWQSHSGLQGFGYQQILGALSEWAADALSGDPELAKSLRRVLPEETAEHAADALHEDGRSGGPLDPAFREYLAACWLAADPAKAPERILERLGDPRWRESLLMALGKLSAMLREAELTGFLLNVLETPDPLAPLIPRTTALLAAAVPEMVQIPEMIVEETASRLIAAWAARNRAGGPPALLDFFARTFALLARAAPFPAVERALCKALAKGSRDRCLAAAFLSRNAQCASVEIAEALTAALPQDREEADWPVDTALRELSASHPDLLPARPGTLRRILRRNPVLLQRFLDSPAWRRIGLALYGDFNGPEGMYRDSALTPQLVVLLEKGQDGKDLIAEIRKALRHADEEIQAEALLALIALGEPMAKELRSNEPAARRALAQVSRITHTLETAIPIAIAAVLKTLKQTPGGPLPEDQICDLVRALIDVALAFGGSPVPLLGLARSASAATRPRLLAEVWQGLLAGAHGDPVYNLAVLLDTKGAFLASPPLLLAETLAAAPASANGRWDRHRGWDLERLAPSPHGNRREILTSALDALAGLADSFDFARGWALAVLSPLLRETGLDVEALILALGSLSERFSARSETVHALAGSESAAALLLSDPGPALLAAIGGLSDPFLRLRALLRLADSEPNVRDELFPSAPFTSFWAWMARLLRPSTTFPPLVKDALALSDPSQRTRILERIARLDETCRARWANLAVRAAENLSDLDDRAIAFARIAPCLPLRRRDPLLLHALRTAGRIPSEGKRAKVFDLLRSHVAVSPRLRRHFKHATAGLENRSDQARARGLSAPLLLTIECALGSSATPLVLGAIVNDLRRESLIPRDMPNLWTALMDDDRRAEALAALQSHGQPGGLKLTAEAADVLDRRIEAGNLEMATSLLPLLEAPEPAALPALDRWLLHEDSGLRSRAALLLAERRGVSAKTVSGVLSLLSDPDGRIRHRAALALHGDFAPGRRPLSAMRLGPAVLAELAKCWRAQRDRAPGVAKIIEWTFQRVEHDDGHALSTWARRLAQNEPGAPEAEVILSTIEHLHPAAEPSFFQALRDGTPQAQRALLRSTCRLLARGRLRDALWQELSSQLSDLDPEAGSDGFLIDGPSALIDALGDRTLAGQIHQVSEAFGRDPVIAREILTQAGQATRLSGPKIRAAVDRIVASPDLLPSLLTWLCKRLGRDVQDVEPFCPINSDLLVLTATVAERLPEEFRAAARDLPELRPRLREAAKFHDSFPGRRSALLLLGSLGHLTQDVLDALRSGLNDVAPVQAAALESLARYREADEEVRRCLKADLTASTPLAAMSAARLLTVLARQASSPASARAEAVRALIQAAVDPCSRRHVYRLSSVPPLRIELLGRLDEIFYEALAEITGLADLLGPEAQEKKLGDFEDSV